MAQKIWQALNFQCAKLDFKNEKVFQESLFREPASGCFIEGPFDQFGQFIGQKKIEMPVIQ